MSEDKETRERLIESARAEFSEKGYTKASLRKICADAGVTTGALYFFFKSKEELFGAVVEPPYAGLKALMTEHFSEEKAMSVSGMYRHVDGDHDELSAALIHHLYAYREEFLLILTKSQGSRFEGCVDEVVELIESSYRVMAENMARMLPDRHVNRYMLHWLTHMTVDSFIHLITHESDEHRALNNMSSIMNFLIRGWTEMLIVPKGDVHV